MRIGQDGPSKFYKNLKVINYEIRGRLRDFSVKICVDRLRTEQILSLVDVPQSISTSFAGCRVVHRQRLYWEYKRIKTT